MKMLKPSENFYRNSKRKYVSKKVNLALINCSRNEIIFEYVLEGYGPDY